MEEIYYDGSEENFGFINIILIIFGLSVLIVFFFDRKLLIKKESFRPILVLCIIAFAAAYFLKYFLQISDLSLWLWAMKMPVISLFIFRIFRFIFMKYHNREPLDTFWVAKEKKYHADKSFNLTYIITGTLVPLAIVLLDLL